VSAPRRVVINADDLGFAPGVNRGIIEAFEAGTLSSASMMVNTPAFPEASALVRDRARLLGVGLHFNLLTGSPLSVVPTLCDPRTGLFFPLGTLAQRTFAGRVSPDDVRRECDAQLAALRAEGIAITHLDSHRHTHALPGVLPAVLASARGAGVRVVRRPLDAVTPSEPVVAAKVMVLRASWAAAIRGVAPEDRTLVTHAPNFRGIALQGAPDVELRLLALLDRLPAGDTEIMMHPGYDDAVLAAQDPYRSERESEVRALCSIALCERLDRGDIKLARFDQLG
jgi:predicted glycoside hydrolase/deacetylase ChbG (UPF0249 family)